MTKQTDLPRWEHKEKAGASQIAIILTNNKTTSTRSNKKVPQMLHKANFKGVLMLLSVYVKIGKTLPLHRR